MTPIPHQIGRPFLCFFLLGEAKERREVSIKGKESRKKVVDIFLSSSIARII